MLSPVFPPHFSLVHPLRAVSSGSFLPIVGTGRDGPIQPQAQLPVNGVQHFHEISGTPAVQSFQFRHKEETVSRILTVTKVLIPCTSRCGDHNKRYTRPCHQRTADSGNFDPPAILRADNDGTPPARYLFLPVFPLFLPYDLLLHWCKGYASIIRSTSLSGVSPYPTLMELFHVRTAVTYLPPADRVSDDTVRAVTLQSTGTDFKLFTLPFPSSIALPSSYPSYPLPAIAPAPLFRTPPVCRYPLYLLHEGSKRFAFDCYYFHNLLIIWFPVTKVSLFDRFLFTFVASCQSFFLVQNRRGALFALYGGYILYFHQMAYREGDLATCYEPASLFLVLQKVIRPFRPFVSTNVPSFDQGKLSGCSSGYAWR